MSKATSRSLTPEQQAERRARRMSKRAAVRARREELTEWFLDRRIKAQKRHAKEDRAAAKERKAHRTRVEAGLPQFGKPKKTKPLPAPPSPLGTSLLPDGRSVTANYTTRRAMGARGAHRVHLPRRREMPGALARKWAKAGK